ncbi:MAG: hypothetical protein AAGJ29_14045, partial [Pseudomonadota bacterium]
EKMMSATKAPAIERRKVFKLSSELDYQDSFQPSLSKKNKHPGSEINENRCDTSTAAQANG